MINESGTGLYKVNTPTTLLWNTMVNYRQLSKMKFWNNGFKVTPIFLMMSVKLQSYMIKSPMNDDHKNDHRHLFNRNFLY